MLVLVLMMIVVPFCPFRVLSFQRLREAAEKAKIELSSAPTTDINLPFITADAGGARHMNMPLSRAKFEELVDDLIERTIEPCKNCIRDAGVTKCDLPTSVLASASHLTADHHWALANAF